MALIHGSNTVIDNTRNVTVNSFVAKIGLASDAPFSPGSNSSDTFNAGPTIAVDADGNVNATTVNNQADGVYTFIGKEGATIAGYVNGIGLTADVSYSFPINTPSITFSLTGTLTGTAMKYSASSSSSYNGYSYISGGTNQPTATKSLHMRRMPFANDFNSQLENVGSLSPSQAQRQQAYTESYTTAYSVGGLTSATISVSSAVTLPFAVSTGGVSTTTVGNLTPTTFVAGSGNSSDINGYVHADNLSGSSGFYKFPFATPWSPTTISVVLPSNSGTIGNINNGVYAYYFAGTSRYKFPFASELVSFYPGSPSPQQYGAGISTVDRGITVGTPTPLQFLFASDTTLSSFPTGNLPAPSTLYVSSSVN
jgi:hypothetical protein